jgi:hypothetical protein
MEWLAAHGLVNPIDVVYAFTSREEALAAGGEEVAQVWQRLASETRPVGSSWGLIAWPGNEPKPPRCVAPSVGAPRLSPLVWKGKLGRAGKKHCEKKLRRDRAREVLQFAIATPCRMRDEYLVVGVAGREDWLEEQIDRLAVQDPARLRRYLATWKQWLMFRNRPCDKKTGDTSLMEKFLREAKGQAF